MAKGYLIAQVTVTDPEAYGRYSKAAMPRLEAYGARLILKPETAIFKEDTARARVAMFEFETFEAAQVFWENPEYAAAREVRAGAAEGEFILVEGAD
jgi:uncharacterized protein (DUF1330 family)